MNKVRNVLLFSAGLALVALIGLCGAGAAAPADPAAGAIAVAEVPASGAVTAASPPSGCTCEDELTCTCGCSPLAGSWIASLWPKEYSDDAIGVTSGKDGKDGKDADGKSKKAKPTLKTFKFAPVNDKCDKFVVNAQAVTRPQRVIRAFPEVTDLTEFVGIACKAESKEVNFTAISFGVERGKEADKTIFIAVLSGTVKVSDEWGKDGHYSADAEKDYSYKCKCCKDDCKDSKCTCKKGDYSDKDHPDKCSCCKNGCKYSDCECKMGQYGKNYGKDQGKDYGKDEDQHKCNEPEKLEAELTVAFFDAEQDEDGDGFPDEREEPIVCLAFKAEFQRVLLQPQCKPTNTSTTTAPTATATADVPQ